MRKGDAPLESDEQILEGMQTTYFKILKSCVMQLQTEYLLSNEISTAIRPTFADAQSAAATIWIQYNRAIQWQK